MGGLNFSLISSHEEKLPSHCYVSTLFNKKSICFFLFEKKNFWSFLKCTEISEEVFQLWRHTYVREQNFGCPSRIWQNRTSFYKGSLRGPVRHAGVLNQPSGTSLNTNTGSIGASRAHLCAHAHEATLLIRRTHSVYSITLLYFTKWSKHQKRTCKNIHWGVDSKSEVGKVRPAKYLLYDLIDVKI